MPASPTGPRRRAVRIPGERRHRLLVIPARATGPAPHPVGLDMVVDPGASLTCLSPEVAANLELNVADPLVVVQLSGIGNATAPVVALDALQVGPLVARGLAIAVLDLPEFLEVDGLLGLDFCDALGLTRLILELDTVALVLR